MQQTHFLNKTTDVVRDKKPKKSNPWMLIFVCLIFVAPILLGSVLYMFRNNFSFRSNARGEVLTPCLAKETLNLPLDHFLGKWQLLYFSPSQCDNECKQNTKLLQNLCIALGKDQSRVVFQTIPFSTQTLTSKASSLPFIAGSVVIIDPKGWLVTHYSPTNFQPKGILDDLRRLMRYSYVG